MASIASLKKFIPLTWRRALARWRDKLAKKRMAWLVARMNALREASPLPLTRLGTDYGGWIVPLDLLSKTSVCYCVGVGEDASFDIALLQIKGCHVYGIDPTPRAITYAESVQREHPAYHVLPYGLWSEDTTLKFYSPVNKAHVSHSVLAGLRGQARDYVLVPCRSLTSLMRELGHTRLDLLKMDIEGAEYAVLDAMLATDIRPKVLCIEFDQPNNVYSILGVTLFFKPLAILRRLRRAGYRLVAVENVNVTLIYQP